MGWIGAGQSLSDLACLLTSLKKKILIYTISGDRTASFAPVGVHLFESGNPVRSSVAQLSRGHL